jgi:ABC-type dipeptide/oligopeptide/nickel transport system permease subunit
MPRISLPRLLRTPSGVFGVVLLTTVVLIALLGPAIAPHSPDDPIGLPASPPSSDAWLGTDELGRDVLSRLLHGGLTVLGLGVAAAAVAYGGGITIGLISGYNRRLTDATLMRGMDVLLAFPALLFVLVFVTGAGPSAKVLVVAVGIVLMPGVSRVVRAATVGVAVSGYVEAAVARGERTPWVLFREILPNISTVVLADFGLRFTWAIVLIASVNFLGVGLAPPISDWGLMVTENRQIIDLNIWAVAAPAAMLALLTVAINLVADAHVKARSGPSA